MKPIDYYSAHEHVISTLSQFKKNAAIVEAHAKANNQTVFWRGQMDHEWPLTSSLVRKLAAVTVPDDELLNSVEKRILDEADGWIDDLKDPKYKEPLARLVYLQHHGIPTRLIDFTTNPWMAMFFACEDMDHTDGRVFAYFANNTDILSTVPAGMPWLNYPADKIAMFDPIASGVVFPRIKAQTGFLAVGKLPSTKPICIGLDPLLKKRRAMLAEEIRRILSISFRLGGKFPPKKDTTLKGITFRIHVDKESVRRDLSGDVQGNRNSPKGSSTRHDSVYPDAAGMVTCSKFLRGLSKGVVIV